jgi:SAM-dependent methyltransferase
MGALCLAGDEWSRNWGNTETQWHATLLPRIRHFLPARHILEIAPGFGRWTGFLIDASEDYVGIDLNIECVNACRDRFADAAHARFVQNDGMSLATVADRSIDFAFSFDSLVHVEIDVIESYIRELSRTLTKNGVALLHHSNLGEYRGPALGFSLKLRRTNGLPGRMIGLLGRLHVLNWDCWRAPSVTAERIADVARANGAVCISQELITWLPGDRRLIDCLTVLTLAGSRWERPRVVIRNPDFTREAASAGVVSRLYPQSDEARRTPAA